MAESRNIATLVMTVRVGLSATRGPPMSGAVIPPLKVRVSGLVKHRKGKRKGHTSERGQMHSHKLFLELFRGTLGVSLRWVAVSYLLLRKVRESS